MTRVAPPIAAGPSAPDDIVVATVDGRPVWSSCVTAQAAKLRGTDDERRRRAVAECVDFELMAGVAHQRGLVDHFEVQEAILGALANRLVALDVEAKLANPESVRPLLEEELARRAPVMNMPEIRDSTFIRVEVADKAPPEAWESARQMAERIHAELAGGGLLPEHLRAAVRRVNKDFTHKVEVERYAPKPLVAIVPEYGRALFAIPEVGQVSPPTRTKWGWDIVLLTQLFPAKQYTREEVIAEVLPDARREYVRRWVDEIVRSYGKITYDEHALEAL